MSNAKAQMPSEIQSSNVKENYTKLCFWNLGFELHLIFGF
jgi:hypothetical protein